MNTLRELILPMLEGEEQVNAIIEVDSAKKSIFLNCYNDTCDIGVVTLPLALPIDANAYNELKAAFLDLMELTGCEHEEKLALVKRLKQ